MDRYLFAVGDNVYCCWEHGLPDRNERFLKGVDADYFEFIARTHGDQLEGEDRLRAAVALRTGYHHGLETLFSFLGALAQAPGAVPAWLPKCYAPALRNVVTSFSAGTSLLTQCGRQRITFDDLSEVVHQFCWPDETPVNATRNRFAQLWRRLASEYLDDHNIEEYRSLKHGFRVAPGGFTLRIGEEEAYGVRAPEANMRTIGGSPYGTSFFEPFGVVADPLSKHHFRIRHAAMNWRAEAMVQRLQLIAWSINNVVGCLRCLNGALPGTIRFIRPEDPDVFEHAWRWDVGVTRSDFDFEVNPADVDAVPRRELLHELKQRTRGIGESAATHVL